MEVTVLYWRSGCKRDCYKRCGNWSEWTNILIIPFMHDTRLNSNYTFSSYLTENTTGSLTVRPTGICYLEKLSQFILRIV
jgi:hypothetical protein